MLPLKLDICLEKTETRSMFVTLYKWIKDLNIRLETLKLVKERAGNTLEAVDIGKEFLRRTQVARQLRERINKWNYIKLKRFCTTKEMVYKLKSPTTEWDKNLCHLYSRQGTDNQNVQAGQKTKFPKNQ
jgi:hypothetical protein